MHPYWAYVGIGVIVVFFYFKLNIKKYFRRDRWRGKTGSVNRNNVAYPSIPPLSTDVNRENRDEFMERNWMRPAMTPAQKAVYEWEERRKETIKKMSKNTRMKLEEENRKRILDEYEEGIISIKKKVVPKKASWENSQTETVHVLSPKSTPAAKNQEISHPETSLITREKIEEKKKDLGRYLYVVGLHEDIENQKIGRLFVLNQMPEIAAEVGLNFDNIDNVRPCSASYATAQKMVRLFKQLFEFVKFDVVCACGEKMISKIYRIKAEQGDASNPFAVRPGEEKDGEEYLSADPSWLCSRCQVFQCPKCGREDKFFRCNNPCTVLMNRRGRCGEFANAFTFLCRSLGWRARLVLGMRAAIVFMGCRHLSRAWGPRVDGDLHRFRRQGGEVCPFRPVRGGVGRAPFVRAGVEEAR
jgi:hypothetical protein